MWNISVNWAPHTHTTYSVTVTDTPIHMHFHTHYPLTHWHSHTYTLGTRPSVQTELDTEMSDPRLSRLRGSICCKKMIDPRLSRLRGSICCHRTTAFWCEGHVDSPTVLSWDKISVFPRFSPAFACWFDRFWLCVPHTSVSRSFSLPVVRFF